MVSSSSTNVSNNACNMVLITPLSALNYASFVCNDNMALNNVELWARNDDNTLVYVFSIDGRMPSMSTQDTAIESSGEMTSSSLLLPILNRALQRWFNIKRSELMQLHSDSVSGIEKLLSDFSMEFVTSSTNLYAIVPSTMNTLSVVRRPYSMKSMHRKMMHAQDKADQLLYSSHFDVDASSTHETCSNSSSLKPVETVCVKPTKNAANTSSVAADITITSPKEDLCMLNEFEHPRKKQKPHSSGFSTFEHPLRKIGLKTSCEIMLNIDVPKSMRKMVARRRYYCVNASRLKQDESPSDKIQYNNELRHKNKTHEDDDDDDEDDDDNDDEDDDDEDDDDDDDESNEDSNSFSQSSTMITSNVNTECNCVSAQMLLLLQQHCFDPFFCRYVFKKNDLDDEEILRFCSPANCIDRELSMQISAAIIDALVQRRENVLDLNTIFTSTQSILSHRRVCVERVDHAEGVVTTTLPELAATTLRAVHVANTFIITGFDGDIRTMPDAAVSFWEQTCLEPIKPSADVIYLVIPSPTITSLDIKSTILPFFDSLSGMYETCFLGRHRRFKNLFNDVLQLASKYRAINTCNWTGSSEDIKSYYEYVLQQLGSSPFRSNLLCVDSNIIVVYFIVDENNVTAKTIAAQNMNFLATILNQLRIVFGAPLWSSTSRRKNVLSQIIPRDVATNMFDGVTLKKRCSVLKELCFSVFSRSHFVPSISPTKTPSLQEGIGITAFEPAFVVHTQSAFPILPHVETATVAKTDMDTSDDESCASTSVLAVHVCYTIINQWLVGASTDMRGERVHTSIIKLKTEDNTNNIDISFAFHNFWTESIRPIIDFLHSRIDQGAMSLVITRIGALDTHEIISWKHVFVQRLGGHWQRYDSNTIINNDDDDDDDDDDDGDDKNYNDISIMRDNEVEDKQHVSSTVYSVDERFSVSSAFIIACAGTPSLQISNDSSESIVMSTDLQGLSSTNARAIASANLYFRDCDDMEYEIAASAELHLISYIIHDSFVSTSNSNMCVTTQKSFAIAVEQTVALKVMMRASLSPSSSILPHLALLPIHFSAVQRLVILLKIASTT